MSLFYNPKTKKAQPWIFVVFILIPVLLIVLLWMSTKKRVKEYHNQQVEKERDIFERVDVKNK